MPNWCSTTITINCQNEQKLKRFEEKLNEWMKGTENGFGDAWLGNIVINSKIGTVNENSETDLRCRGSVVYMERFENQLVIDTETAWSPMLQMWQKLLEKYLPDAELIYSAEECGCGLYCTNDIELAGRYRIEIWGNINISYDNCWDASEKEVIGFLQKLLKTSETNLDVLMSELKKSKFVDDIYIHQWEYTSVDELY